jgi:hypothetical protein
MGLAEVASPPSQLPAKTPPPPRSATTTHLRVESFTAIDSPRRIEHLVHSNYLRRCCGCRISDATSLCGSKTRVFAPALARVCTRNEQYLHPAKLVFGFIPHYPADAPSRPNCVTINPDEGARARFLASLQAELASQGHTDPQGSAEPGPNGGATAESPLADEHVPAATTAAEATAPVATPAHITKRNENGLHRSTPRQNAPPLAAAQPCI